MYFLQQFISTKIKTNGMCQRGGIISAKISDLAFASKRCFIFLDCVHGFSIFLLNQAAPQKCPNKFGISFDLH